MKNIILILFLFVISNQIILAQDLTFGLQVNDLSAKPMQPLAKPGYLQAVTDPSFGTTIRRITNVGAGNVVKTMYSTVQAWNADESLMILYHRSDEDEANLGLAAGNNYFGEPHAVISPTGTRVLFGSDWSGAEDGQSIDAYVVELPSYGSSPPEPAQGNQNAVIPGNIKIDPTFEHLAILYNVSGDENLNSDLKIEFREQGNGAYKNGAITMRTHPSLVIDGTTPGYNHHAGSALFLQPNTTYDIRLTLTDPNGGGTTTTVQATTRKYPTESNNFRYVAPGSSGGNGTSGNPYRGLQTAADNAQPGITFIVQPGTYSSFNIATDGTANAPITFRSETTHAAIVDGGNTNSGVIVLGDFSVDSLQHIIIDGLKIQNGNYGIDAQHTQYLTIKNCWIENVVWGIYNRRENGWEHDQYITNNYISGRTAWPVGGTEHRGIDIRGNQNVISFNTIKNFDDAISTDGAPYAVSYAMDIHNNDIQNMADDLVEVDGTISNTRVYRNRMYNGRAGVSLAPVFGGPCYVFRNEMYNMAEGFSAYKMNRGPSGLVIVHNSSSKLGNGMSSPVGWQNTFFKNNVLIGTRYCFEEFGLVNGSNDDWDYNAYYSTRPGNNTQGEEWFKWNNIRYGNVTELQNEINIGNNGIDFNLNSDIGNATPPANYQVEYSPGDADFQPTNGSNFRNNGIDLDNLNDEYVTDGQPDRGAYEFGKPLPTFGASFNIVPLVPQNQLTPGAIKIDPTFEHIAVLYNVSGDANLNSKLQIEFRKQGNGTYKNGAVTMRAHPGLVIDGTAPGYNHHAGSAMFLQPNTTYDIRLTLTDPDGGGTTTTVQATTKAYPTETNNFRYVTPGSSGGSGTSGNPYRGLQTAADNAQAGITFIVRPGNYSSFEMGTDGTANAPITFRSETRHAAIVDGGNTNSGIIILGNIGNDSLQHIIIDGLKIQNGNIAIDAQHTQHLTIKNCWIEDVTFGIYNRRENGWEHDQYITNNYFLGRTNWPNGGTEHRAIDIRGNRNVVSFNTIKNFDDGVSTDGPPYQISYALDIHNNDIQNMVDDFLEVDGTISNTRVYRNRGYNGRSGVSVAPVFGGPCYVFRNELYNMDISAFKMNRGTAGIVLVHNTSSKEGNGMSSDGWQNTFIKNNVIIGSRYCFEEFGLVDDSIDDWDYNAYLSTRGPATGAEWFKWDNDRYATINDLRNATNIEDNGLTIGNIGVINAPPPANYTTEYTPDDTNFQPYNAANFRNNGIDLDNINDGFVFDGMPDRGAYEYANTLPKFGVNFAVTSTCTLNGKYAIALATDGININYTNNNTGTLMVSGLINAYDVTVENANGTEISSAISGSNELSIDLCDLQNGLHYLVIKNNAQSNIYVKLIIVE